MVVLWWCICAGVFVLALCFCGGVLVFCLWWCGGGVGGVVVFLWWCFCGAVVVWRCFRCGVFVVFSVVVFFPKAAAKGSFKKSSVIKHCYQTLPKVLLK